MKKTTINISYSEEKYNALKIYLEQKQMKVEDEIIKAIDTLFTKNVPSGVREFIELKNSNNPINSKVQRKQKSAVENTSNDDNNIPIQNRL